MDDLSEVLDESQDRLARIIEAAMPATDARSRARIAGVLWDTLQGEYWPAIAKSRQILWCRWGAYIRNYPLLNELYHLARAEGEHMRRAQRDAEAHRRAVDGVDDPVYWRGEQVGAVRRYSDRLLELLHREDHPELYPRESGPQVTVQVQQLLQSLSGHGPASLVAPENRADAPPPAKTPENIGENVKTECT